MDEFEHHENIRARIQKLVREGAAGINLSPEVEHLLVNICKLMYDKGIHDGHRICQKVISLSMNVYKE